jgi:Fic-DOC domain mobile mystery protein B
MVKFTFEDSQTPINADEAADLIPAAQSLKDLDFWEEKNILQARNWLMKSHTLNKHELFSEGFIKKLHFRLFDQTWKWAGEYRNSDKNIGCDAFEIQIELKKLNGDAKFWLENNSFAIKEIAVLYHHRLVKIHPFANGNGRHARLTADAIMAKYGDEKINWLGDYKDNNELRKNYISALREADLGNCEPLIKLLV